MKELILKGGPLMWGIILFSIIAFTIMLEKIYYLYIVENTDFEKTREEFYGFIERKDFGGARAYCLARKDSMGKLLKGLLENQGEPKDILEDKASEIILDRVEVLEKRMWFLGIVMNLAPALGLLGTVTGMVKIFSELAKGGIGRPEILSAGIGEALISTAAGLIILVPVTIIVGFFNSKIDKIVSELEKSALEFINIMKGF